MAQPWSAYPCTGFQQQRVKISTQLPYYSKKNNTKIKQRFVCINNEEEFILSKHFVCFVSV